MRHQDAHGTRLNKTYRRALLELHLNPGSARKQRCRRRWNGEMFETLELRMLLSVATINWATQEQTISGFGASSAWMGGTFTGSQQQLLWSTTNGAGLSILRSKIDETSSITAPTSGESSIMQEAQAMGVTIFSTPWSMPAQFKSNNSINNGGTLLSTSYQAYANWLAACVMNMKNTYGVTLYAVSMQNEPDWVASYDSSTWTAAEFDTVLFQYVEPTFAADGLTTKIMLPEETHWDSLDLVSTVLADSRLANYSNLIFADHTYGDYSNNNPITGLGGNPIWETEHTGDNPNVGVQAALDLAESIYHVVGQNQASAYNYWWINSGGGAGLLGGNWQSTYNFAAMENYSKFIRPGWVQVGESDDNSGLQICAFKNPATGNFATELINNSNSPITETVNLNGAYASVVTPWVTSATLSVAQQQSIPATGNGGSYTYTVPAKSIVTLTGTATTTPVTEVPVGLLASAATTSSITLSWTSNLASATGYTVQRSSDGTTWSTITTSVPAGSYTYTDSGLPANTQYYYRVQANNGTLFSNVMAQMTQPPAPTNLTASYNSSNQTVTLNWTRNGSSATDYAVDVSSDGGVTWTTQTAGLSSGTSSYTDNSAPELATLQYRVRAVYGANSSVPTNLVSVTTTVLKAPTGFTVATGTGKSLVLTWTDGTTTNSTVSIERSTDNATWTVIATVNHGVQTYTDSTVAEGGTYYYRIRNYDGAVTTYSAYATASPVTVPPAAPTHLEVEFSPLPTLMAELHWVDNSTSETAYEVDRSSNAGTTWTTLTTALPAGSTTYTDTTVISGQAYEYRVEALNHSASSAQVTTLSETASALPTFAHGDIGDPGTLGLAGSAVYNATANSYTLTGSGTDIWNTGDGFQFAFTTLTGDGTVTARIASLSATNSWAKAGLMIRDGLAVGAAFVNDVVTPGNGAGLQWRATPGGNCNNSQTTGITAPIWLRLTRTGNVFRAYYSSDNVTYTQIGNGTTITMGSTVYVGLIDCAHDATQLATATFSNFTLTGTGNQTPAVATSAAANPSPATGTTANLSVLGSDSAGEGTLIYTWATTGSPPAPVTFSTNGQNASKNTLATFTSAGSYSFLVTITDQFGLSTTSSFTLTVNQTVIGTSLSPATITVAPNSSTQLTLAAVDEFGNPVGSQGAVAWSVYAGSGSINSSGLYTAPGNESGLVTVRAVGASGQPYYSTIDVLNQLAWFPGNATGGTLLSDVTGHGWNGTLSSGAAFAPGINGNALSLTNGYAALPTGVVSSLSNFTIAAWVNLASIANWARIFDFGTGTNTYMFLSPKNGSTNVIRFAITTSSSGGEQQINGTAALATGSWQFVAVTLNGNVGTLYVNGVAVGTNTNMTLHPSSLGATTQNYLGKSQWSDPTLQGRIEDFRIVGRALSASEIQQLAKPTIVTGAAASVVTSTSAKLSVLAADVAAGESGVTYTWATTGTPPAPVTLSANATNAAKNITATFTKAGTYNFLVTATDAAGVSATSSVSVTINSSMLARQMFYGNSVFDGATHDGAIAPDKLALLPGQTATFANYSSFSRGLNGVEFDILNPAGTFTPADFTFQVGNDNNPSAWAAAPAPLSVVNRPGAGIGGATRVEITWADGAIVNQWLQVTIKGGGTSGLAANDVFYFGNTPGEVGTDPTAARVDVVDLLVLRAARGMSAPLTSPYDINRDGAIDANDMAAAQANMTWAGNQLQLIAPPAMAQPQLLAAGAPAFLAATASSASPRLSLSGGISVASSSVVAGPSAPAAPSIVVSDVVSVNATQSAAPAGVRTAPENPVRWPVLTLPLPTMQTSFLSRSARPAAASAAPKKSVFISAGSVASPAFVPDLPPPYWPLG